jgi:hypothetical protein
MLYTGRIINMKDELNSTNNKIQYTILPKHKGGDVSELEKWTKGMFTNEESFKLPEWLKIALTKLYGPFIKNPEAKQGLTENGEETEWIYGNLQEGITKKFGFKLELRMKYEKYLNKIFNNMKLRTYKVTYSNSIQNKTSITPSTIIK